MPKRDVPSNKRHDSFLGYIRPRNIGLVYIFSYLIYIFQKKTILSTRDVQGGKDPQNDLSQNDVSQNAVSRASLSANYPLIIVFFA